MNTCSVFEPFQLGRLRLRNRFVRSATWEAMADTRGEVSDQLLNLYRKLAEGGVGAVITGHTYVLPEGKSSFRQTGSYTDNLGLERLVHAVHPYKCPLILQISHGGSISIHDDHVSNLSNKFINNNLSQKLDEKHMERIRNAFVKATLRAKTAGFDAVQMHCAHGFLFSEMISPLFNQRTDDFGGNTEKRMRFPLSVLDAMRAEVGPQYPILIKINSDDFCEGGMTPEEMVRICSLLDARGDITAIEISGGNRKGTFWPARLGRVQPGIETEGYYIKAAQQYKESVHTPLILVGGFRSLEAASYRIQEGLVDCIALSRPLIREPGLIARWQNGFTEPSDCLSCNGCYKPAAAGEGIRCVYAEKHL
jgi:2,4-dienoyl-CoA reductase-like NADH-dependent reductase (Old Yellow Enzyme family)